MNKKINEKEIKNKLSKSITKAVYICRNSDCKAYLLNTGEIKCFSSIMSNQQIIIGEYVIAEISEVLKATNLKYIKQLTNRFYIEIKENYKIINVNKYNFPFRIIEDFQGSYKGKLPVGKNYSFFKEKKYDENFSYIFSIVSMWLKQKIIFEFDKDFLSDIIQATRLEDLSIDILNKIPFKQFYCIGEIKNKQSGFLINLDDNVVSILIITGTFSSGKTLVEKSNLIFEKIVLSDENKSIKLSDCVPRLHNTLKQIVYLCSYNPEIIISDKEKLNKINKDFKGETFKSFDVGYELGNTLRQYKILQKKTETNIHNNKRPIKPHYRRGHYHSFWTGKRNGERTKIIKWIDSTIVNGNKESIAEKPTVHKIN